MFTDGADLQADVNHQAIVGVQRDSRLLGTLEPGVRRSNSVKADRKVGKVVLSVPARGCGPAKPSLHVRDGDFSASDCRALFVGYRAANGGGCDLCMGCERNCKQKHECTEERTRDFEETT